jgi:hypothetical protein
MLDLLAQYTKFHICTLYVIDYMNYIYIIYNNMNIILYELTS